jgi:hypothetical protein
MQGSCLITNLPLENPGGFLGMKDGMIEFPYFLAGICLILLAPHVGTYNREYSRTFGLAGRIEVTWLVGRSTEEHRPFPVQVRQLPDAPFE